MFQTGSQINPSLGRTDYSAYAQGAIAGGQAIGQGIANLGQGIASGIEAYTKKKEENKKLDDATSVVSNLVKSDPKIAAFFNLKPNESGEYDLKAIKSAVKTVGAGPILQLAQQNQEFNRTQENESRTAQAALALGGSGMGPVLPENRASVLESRGFTPQQISAAQAYNLNLQAKQAEIANAKLNADKTQAEIDVLKIPKSTYEFNSIEEAQAVANKMANAAGGNTIGRADYNPKTGKYSPVVSQQAQPNVQDPYKEQAAKLRIANDQSLVQSAENAVQEIKTNNDIIALVDSGNVNTGAAGAVSQYVDKALSFFGSPDAISRASATELLDSFLGKAFLDLRAKQNITSTMMNTPAELSFYRDIFSGTKTLEPASIKKLAELKILISKGAIDTHNRAVKSGDLNEFYLSTRRKQPELIEVPTYSKEPVTTITAGGRKVPSANTIFGNKTP
jgi:hypothetical protein